MGRLPPRTAYGLLLAACGALYFGFHAVRDALPVGLVQGSFPSVVVWPVLFCAAELTPGVRFHTRRSKLQILGAVGVAAMVWLEGVAPFLYPRSVGDLWDVAAMAAGFAMYWAFDATVVCHNPEPGTEVDAPP